MIKLCDCGKGSSELEKRSKKMAKSLRELLMTNY